MDRCIVRRFLRNFAMCKIPFQNLFRIICIIGFVWTMYTYSVQERSSITWLYVAVQIISNNFCTRIIVYYIMVLPLEKR